MCREGAGSVAAYGGLFIGSRPCKRSFFFRGWRKASEKGGGDHVSGPLPQVAAQDLRGRHRPGPHHRDPAKAGGRGPDLPRLPLHRHPGHRQDHLRQDPGQGRELRTPRGRQPLLRLPLLPRHRERQLSGRAGAGRRLQQRRGPGPGPAGRGHLLPRPGQKAGLHHRRGPHALPLGLQRPAEDPGGAAGAPDVHSGHHGAPQGARHHPLPLPALLLPPHPAQGHRGPAPVCGPAGEHPPDGERRGAPLPSRGRGAAGRPLFSRPVRGGGREPGRPGRAGYPGPRRGTADGEAAGDRSPAGRPGGALTAQ